MSIIDKVTAPETQMGVTGGLFAGYAITLNEVIGSLTILVLLGQLGLMYPKYKVIVREWLKKHGWIKR